MSDFKPSTGEATVAEAGKEGTPLEERYPSMRKESREEGKTLEGKSEEQRLREKFPSTTGDLISLVRKALLGEEKEKTEEERTRERYPTMIKKELSEEPSKERYPSMVKEEPRVREETKEEIEVEKVKERKLKDRYPAMFRKSRGEEY